MTLNKGLRECLSGEVTVNLSDLTVGWAAIQASPGLASVWGGGTVCAKTGTVPGKPRGASHSIRKLWYISCLERTGNSVQGAVKIKDKTLKHKRDKHFLRSAITISTTGSEKSRPVRWLARRARSCEIITLKVEWGRLAFILQVWGDY